ncbi:enoyl-CoA hydratase/isomerase family protein [Ralstonia sp. UBA689]|uniref:enoyl-CoA hydratase/isomerase family protein n=1 Tax=Ralstonia sp. UBA689 TaxID=1947373 RepID=UPI0025EBD5A0|nr:enoyl-CoA hydratase/isomerase family protein [Ralstonia sp. UBA689]
MNMPASELALFERIGGTAIVRLNRPARHNSLVPELLEGLLAALDRAEADSQVEVVVLTHAGRNFSTGGDVEALASQGNALPAYADRLLELLNRTILRVSALRCPIIAAVEGWLTGGSLGLVLACDMAVLSHDVRIAPFYTVVGFSPDGGWTAMLPQLVGTARARAWQLNNTTLTAEEAGALGLAARVVESGQAEHTAMALAVGIQDKVRGSVAQTRALLRWDSQALADGLERERAAFVAQIQTAEADAGMRRFLDRGKRT